MKTLAILIFDSYSDIQTIQVPIDSIIAIKKNKTNDLCYVETKDCTFQCAGTYTDILNQYNLIKNGNN